MKITGISHLTFVVKDLEMSASHFKKIFGAREIYDSNKKNFSTMPEKFLLIGDIWIALMEGVPVQERSYQHIAFKVNLEDLAEYRKKIIECGLEIKESRNRIKGEGESLYFYDSDDHLFELHTDTLEERLQKYSNFIKDENE